MFGKRANSTAVISAATPSAPARAHEPAVASVENAAPSAASDASRRSPAESRRSDGYYQTKSMIFGALIEAIDLSALAKLDPDNAREEIRDIVHEIVTIKNIVLSISEQEAFLEDICNDALVYARLEPFLA